MWTCWVSSQARRIKSSSSMRSRHIADDPVAGLLPELRAAWIWRKSESSVRPFPVRLSTTRKPVTIGHVLRLRVSPCLGVNGLRCPH